METRPHPTTLETKPQKLVAQIQELPSLHPTLNNSHLSSSKVAHCLRLQNDDKPKNKNSNLQQQKYKTLITGMSEVRDYPTNKLMGKTVQTADDQQRKYMKGKVFRYEDDESSFGKNALANLRANPAAMSRSMKFHESS